MASKVVVFQESGSVAQASLTAADVIQSAKEETLAQWTKVVDVLYDTIGDPKSDLDCAKGQYLAAGSAGGSAFIAVTPGARKNRQAVLQPPSGRYRRGTDLVFGAIASARAATARNLVATNTTIDDTLVQLPVEEAIKSYFTLAESNAPQAELIATVKQINANHSLAMKALAAYQAGIATQIDTSSKAAALAAMLKAVDIIYGLLPNQGS